MQQLRHVTACTAVSTSLRIFKVATSTVYVRDLAVAFLKLQYPGGSLFLMPMVHSLCGEKVKFPLLALGAFITRLNIVLGAIMPDFHAQGTQFIYILFCARAYVSSYFNTTVNQSTSLLPK